MEQIQAPNGPSMRETRGDEKKKTETGKENLLKEVKDKYDIEEITALNTFGLNGRFSSSQLIMVEFIFLAFFANFIDSSDWIIFFILLLLFRILLSSPEWDPKSRTISKFLSSSIIRSFNLLLASYLI